MQRDSQTSLCTLPSLFFFHGFPKFADLPLNFSHGRKQNGRVCYLMFIVYGPTLEISFKLTGQMCDIQSGSLTTPCQNFSYAS